MPEINWLWRRVYIFAVTAGLLYLVWNHASTIDDVGTLREIIRNDQLLIGLLILLYIAGASTEAITRLVAAIKTSRKETVTEAPVGVPTSQP